MKKISLYIIAIGLLIGCTDNLKDATDFTSVTNPNLAEPVIVGVPNSAAIWLTGVKRQTSNVLNEGLILAELGSDNYVNTQTFYDQFMDDLTIGTDNLEIEDLQFQIARLREMSKFGLETVGPADPEYNNDTEAEYNFYEGLSYLYAAMYFSGLPQEEAGPAISVADNYASAINSFDNAIDLAEKAEFHLAKARANYYLGNQVEAVSSANTALGLSTSFLRSVEFDESNLPANTFESALYERATFDDLQPLPTLDFLDPKYSFVSAEEDPPVHILKAEEAHLILAEANLASGNLGAAQGNLEDLLAVVATRNVRNIDDSIEGRPDGSANSENFPARPDTTTVTVNGRAGLVLYRGEKPTFNDMGEPILNDDGEPVLEVNRVDIPSVSGTSLTQADIDALTAADDTALELLYRTRQEIFIAEGLRFVDMGVKLVIHINEISQNPNISDGDPSTIPVIPSFINAVKGNLDAITYNVATGVATTAINLTEILVSNKTSDQVLPFH